MPAPPLGKQDGQMTSFYSFKTIIMRNYLLSLLVALLAVTGSLPAAAQEAYAVLTPDDGTLTFYYDNQYAHFVQNHGRVYDMPKPGERPTWAGDNEADLYQKISSMLCLTFPFPSTDSSAPALGSKVASI